MEKKHFLKLLNYYDEILWDRKVDETNFNYLGLTLDFYFEDTNLNTEYLDVEDYITSESNITYIETKRLSDQYENAPENNRIYIVEKILNIFNHSSYNKEISSAIITKTTNYLKRNGVIANASTTNDMSLSYDNIVDQGYYCVITKYSEKIYKKELKEEFKSDEKLCKRVQYEFENMKKLKDCPNILNVFSYSENENSYLMEKADSNLYSYLINEVNINQSQKNKIIMDILNGMKYAHKNSIIHRDLHLGNILRLNNDFVLCDFGLSKDESIERSLVSSPNQKNNHFFMDPIGLNDFTKLDKKSDIYSIGKIIDYIYSMGNNNTKHIFSYVVDKCTSRHRNNRYNSIEEIIEEINFKIHDKEDEKEKIIILEKIQNIIFDVQVSDLILELINKNILCEYIINNRLNNFGFLIIQFNVIEQINILKEIENNFVSATGYGKFHNYDIFANISNHICMNTDEDKVFNMAFRILEECAKYRFNAEDLLKQIKAKKI